MKSFRVSEPFFSPKKLDELHLKAIELGSGMWKILPGNGEQFAIDHGHLVRVDLPIQKWWICHSYGTVYQRINQGIPAMGHFGTKESHSHLARRLAARPQFFFSFSDGPDGTNRIH